MRMESDKPPLRTEAPANFSGLRVLVMGLGRFGGGRSQLYFASPPGRVFKGPCRDTRGLPNLPARRAFETPGGARLTCRAGRHLGHLDPMALHLGNRGPILPMKFVTHAG